MQYHGSVWYMTLYLKITQFFSTIQSNLCFIASYKRKILRHCPRIVFVFSFSMNYWSNYVSALSIELWFLILNASIIFLIMALTERLLPIFMHKKIQNLFMILFFFIYVAHLKSIKSRFFSFSFYAVNLRTMDSHNNSINNVIYRK
jgi:hypothetical protein